MWGWGLHIHVGGAYPVNVGVEHVGGAYIHNVGWSKWVEHVGKAYI